MCSIYQSAPEFILVKSRKSKGEWAHSDNYHMNKLSPSVYVCDLRKTIAVVLETKINYV